MKLIVNEIRLYPAYYVRAVLRHMGPEFWIVAVFPFYISWIWASGEIFPAYSWLEENPTGAGSYLVTVHEWLKRTWEFWLGAIVIGPLLGGGTVLYDDFFDRDIDRDNPRKNTLPFQKAPARAGVILGSAVLLFVLSLVLAALISPVFFALSMVIVVLSLVYSTPPLRLKGRGGMDLATNMVGFGVVCSLAGFSIAAPISEYPWLWLVVMVLGTGALYVPTTVADIYSDGKNGVRTVAVKLGIPSSVKLSMVLLLLANIAIVALGLGNYLYDVEVLLWVWPFSVLEFVPLLYLLRRRDIDDVIKVLFALSSLMALGTFMLALNHVGIWTP